ncbi:hypothetical protein LCGC14_0401830 [marine sediment metagenome]|uniref:DNA-directed DNA polymerase n=1 Tax=marine sediment metagenome TaxID=412755 RepID=A0A0F9SWU7_9ZZZZ
MARTLIQTAEQLPRFDPKEPLFVDLETTSFDDGEPAFQPFKGHRAAGYAICTADGRDAWYLPLRHHGSDVAEKVNHNFDLKQAQSWLQGVIGSGRDIHNHNIKFDGRFWHFDGCEAKGRLVDTLVLARLVDNDRVAYGLNALTGSKTDEDIKAYLKSIKSKDYGRVPIDLMARYAMNDVVITQKLEVELLKKLRPETAPVWDVEQRLTSQLLKWEIHGIRVNKRRLAKAWRVRLEQAIGLEEQVHEAAGVVFDVNSDKDVTRVMIGKLGIEPVAWTKSKNPQWNKEALAMIHHPIARLLAECRREYHFCSLFCEGWLKRIGDDGRMHANFNLGGTRTGRLSSSDPNLQNSNDDAKQNIDADEDCDIVSSDFSQIEYRLFGHYAGDREIIAAYAANPNQDYHQALADMLGISRQVAKTMNFAFIYGMGKRKLLRKLSVMMAHESEDSAMIARLTSFLPNYDGHELQEADYDKIASNVFDTYHRKMPAVRKLTRRVKDKVEVHGYLRNWRGRIYRFPDPQYSYKAPNYLIQGSAADIFKERLLAVLEQFPYARLVTNVHDDCVFSVPKDMTEEFVREHRKVLVDVQPVEGTKPLRVPMVVETKVSSRVWGQAVKVGDDGDVAKALAESEFGHAA